MEKQEHHPNATAKRVVVPGQRVRVEAEMARLPVPAQLTHSKVNVSTVRNGDTVQFIDITCTCGEHIRLVCEYEGTD